MQTMTETLQKLIGKPLVESTDQEIYLALLDLVRSKSAAQVRPVNGRKLYYISAEFLIGKLLSNNLINLGLYDDVRDALAAAGKSLSDIEEVEPEPSLGNGGLGRLAACFLDSLATLNLPGDGIGLRYHFGLFHSHLKPLWDDILLLVASVANCLLNLWNNLLAPVAKWIIATFGPAFAEVFNAIADVVGVAVGAIADAIDLAVVVLRGLTDFLSAVFRGNWDAAWQAIGNTVNTVWDKMTNAIKTAVNGIIGFINRMISAVVTGINAVINALNGLSFDLPDIFGGGHVGFNISTLTAPQIPYLAQGAVIPANREFLAVLGDQRHGTNVEAPLDTIKQAVAEVMEDLQAGQMAGFEAVVAVLREILSAVYGIELTDEDVGRAVQRWQHKQLIATGGV